MIWIIINEETNLWFWQMVMNWWDTKSGEEWEAKTLAWYNGIHRKRMWIWHRSFEVSQAGWQHRKLEESHDQIMGRWTLAMESLELEEFLFLELKTIQIWSFGNVVRQRFSSLLVCVLPSEDHPEAVANCNDPQRKCGAFSTWISEKGIGCIQQPAAMSLAWWIGVTIPKQQCVCMKIGFPEFLIFPHPSTFG